MKRPHPIRRLRRLVTPPCRECAHYGEKLVGLLEYVPVCRCERYLVHEEKLRCVRHDSAHCDIVRGTRFCAFESEEDG